MVCNFNTEFASLSLCSILFLFALLAVDDDDDETGRVGGGGVEWGSLTFYGGCHRLLVRPLARCTYGQFEKEQTHICC